MQSFNVINCINCIDRTIRNSLFFKIIIACNSAHFHCFYFLYILFVLLLSFSNNLFLNMIMNKLYVYFIFIDETS